MLTVSATGVAMIARSIRRSASEKTPTRSSSPRARPAKALMRGRASMRYTVIAPIVTAVNTVPTTPDSTPSTTPTPSAAKPDDVVDRAPHLVRELGAGQVGGDVRSAGSSATTPTTTAAARAT
jgi:hypothetical protein